MSTRLKNIYYPESLEQGYSAVDGTVAFYTRLQALVLAESVVLDVGCGRGQAAEDPVPYRRDLQIFKGKAQCVIGIDLDPVGKDNPALDEFRLIDSAQWPIDDESIDVLFSDYVLEHLDDPTAFFSEVARVLKPGGAFAFRTPNKWGYSAIVTRLIPNRWHARITGAVQEGREEEDVFPTRFKANTPSVLKKLGQSEGLDLVVIGHAAEPAYLSFCRMAYAFGVLLERWAPPRLKRTLLIYGHKKAP